MGKRNTGCYWYKFSEFKSLESSDSVQHNEGNQETLRNGGARTRKQSVRPGDFLLSWTVGGGTQYLRSWPKLEMSSRDRALLATHHVVLEC